MINTLDNLNEIKAMCSLFKALGAQTDGETGLHINVGVDYFKGKIEALEYLLIIWGECEELFFKIANEESEEIRVQASTMAIPIKANIQKTLKENSNIKLDTEEDFNRFIYNIQVRDELSNLLKFSSGDLEFELMSAKSIDDKYRVFRKYMQQHLKDDTGVRYTSINFNHMTWNKNDKGRIEFRLFNSSLSVDVIMQNLLLIGKLFETCLKLASDSKYKKRQFNDLLNHNVSEEEKLDLLLNLLFDNENEKQIFKLRWISIKDKFCYQEYSIGQKTFVYEEKNFVGNLNTIYAQKRLCRF